MVKTISFYPTDFSASYFITFPAHTLHEFLLLFWHILAFCRLCSMLSECSEAILTAAILTIMPASNLSIALISECLKLKWIRSLDIPRDISTHLHDVYNELAGQPLGRYYSGNSGYRWWHFSAFTLAR